jgi:TM2 domain-containing membrane protein YozV
MSDFQVSKEKKLTLLLLCFLFGFFGLHRFYAGKYSTGAAQLILLGLCGLFAYLSIESLRPVAIIVFFTLILWWIIDNALIIMGKFTDKRGAPIIDWV